MPNTLFSCQDPIVWRGVCQKYWEVVAYKSTKNDKKPGKLMALDKWYQQELPEAIGSRPERLLTHAELVKLMEWKLTRGKFRPRLQQMVATNAIEAVERCTKKAFALLPDVQAAIVELSTLKGVGPATASAVLAAGAPQLAAFMADEAVESIPGLKPIQYTAKHYLHYVQKVTERAQVLNKGDPGQDWTPHMVELCLWTWSVASRLHPSLLNEFITDVKPEKVETSNRPAKRQKTK